MRSQSALNPLVAYVFQLLQHLLRGDVSLELVQVGVSPDLHAQVLGLWESFRDDPALFQAAQRWPADAAKGLPESQA